MARGAYEDEIIISWVELHRDARYLSEVLHQKGPWKGIIAVTRGPAPAMPIGVIQVVRASEDEGEEAKRRFMHFPPTQGPRPAA